MLDPKILQRILDKKKLLDKKRPLSASVLRHLKEYFSIEWTYNSNAIEGNSLTLNETQLVLKEGITIKGKSLNEHFEAKNHEKAIQHLDQIVSSKYQIIEEDILHLHALVLDGIEEEFAGRYRNGQVRILGANFIPPNALKVSEFMQKLVQNINQNPDNLDIISHVAKAHHQFVWIHPFFDGNGRTARLITNLWLMKYGFPPAVILKNDRKKYYDALNKANKGDFAKLKLLIAQTIERSLDMYLETIGEKEKYRLLSELASETPYSQEYLSLLARQGKIDAYKESRNWYSTLEAIHVYSRQTSRNS